MSEETITVNKEIVTEFYKLAGLKEPEEVTDESLLEVLIKLKHNNIESEPQYSYNLSSNNILVIDDIGIVTYQLKTLLKSLGYNVQVAKDIFSGINTFIKSNYAFIIMDLFVSTEQEGFTLLHTTKKIITKNNLDTKIIVITASNKSENKVKCLNGGADIFLKKDVGWQDKLIELIENHGYKIV